MRDLKIPKSKTGFDIKAREIDLDLRTKIEINKARPAQYTCTSKKTGMLIALKGIRKKNVMDNMTIALSTTDNQASAVNH